MFLQRHLRSEFLEDVRHRGMVIHQSRAVTLLSGNQWKVTARVMGSSLYSVELSRQGDEITAVCNCPYFRSDGFCKHLWATILAADEKSYLLGKFGSRPPRLVGAIPLEPESDDEDEDNPIVEFKMISPQRGRKPAYLQSPKPPPPTWRQLLSPLKNAPSVIPYSRQERSAAREIFYVIDIPATYYGDGLCLKLECREQNRNGVWGKQKSLRLPTALLADVPDPVDRDLLIALSGSARSYYSYQADTVPSECQLKNAALEVLLPRICATGRCRLRATPQALPDDLSTLSWDAGDPWQFRLQLEQLDKKWALRGILERGEERMALAEPAPILECGILIARGAVARWKDTTSFRWVSLLRKESQIQAPASQGSDLVAEILQSAHAPDIELPEELRFEEVAAEPKPLLRFAQPINGWSKTKLRGQLVFDYAGQPIPFDTHSKGLYDPAQRRYLRRDQPLEEAAIEFLSELGLKRSDPHYAESGPRWEIASARLPAAVRRLVEAGWKVEAEGKTFRKASAFRTELGSGVDWFELHGAADYDGVEVKLPELLKAIQRGDNLVPLGNGSYGILPEQFLEKYGMLTGLGRVKDDHVRFTASQTGLLDVLLAARPEIQVDEVFARARQELRRFEGIASVPQPEGFVGTLRGYQCEGLAWLYFLRRLGFGGCLADDMGVGKTPQVLALLEERCAARRSGDPAGPSLAVVPRSLVYNWAQEAARFTPRLRVLDYTGATRERGGAGFEGYDLILTTYGTLRRDAALLQELRFDYVILDEAQAIKNADSESAKAVRLLQANHRLAMSGTPIENHLGELWSIFEFLNPGMLGAASPFKGASLLKNPDEDTRRLLAKALRPFILRRTKSQVAKELPEKTEQTLYCELDTPQRKLYDELREHYRQTLLGRIAAEGMGKSKIQILEALLRLRQAACHPGLIDKKRTGDSSAKLESLIPQLAEVMAEGHKALVFSQFTSMLSIVRDRLDQTGVDYEYLDGKTRDRQACIERFQNDPDCKLFLISLKAGGVGLNLTAAEYVFLLDPWWNPAVEAQAIDRTHRIGQSRRVFAYRLIARDTVEEKVLELQKSKRELAEAIIGEDNRLVGNLKREDLELLLS